MARRKTSLSRNPPAPNSPPGTYRPGAGDHQSRHDTPKRGNINPILPCFVADYPISVQAGRDTVLDVPGAVGDPIADTTQVEIQKWAIYLGNCDHFSASSNPDIATNYCFECQGVRAPGTPRSSVRLNTNVNWSYGTGSRLRLSAIFNRRQLRSRGTPSNSAQALGQNGSNSIYTLNWTQNLTRSAERALALEIGLSYQQDRFFQSALTRTSELESYAPFGGFLIKPLEYLFDRDQFPIDQELVENIRDGIPNSRRAPILRGTS
ncbi:MAG: hypothetical protein IIA36_14590, partial [Proteobacteria bacterium]|nr:hypothetical protein [Pseudomonadota bacterium]